MSVPWDISKEKSLYWDCHEHRDELWVTDQNTVYHEEKGQLCYYECRWNGVFFYPIIFKDKLAAMNWIKSGYISELQISLNCLQIGFTCHCFRPME